ncbi:MAG: hypothetical protein IKP69_02005 [Oscillospiraceae bacterium]|nr:hypothetical protein [Oscillospiraceae bacterium]
MADYSKMPEYMRKSLGLSEDWEDKHRDSRPTHEVRWVCPRCGTTNRRYAAYGEEDNLRCSRCGNLKP